MYPLITLIVVGGVFFVVGGLLGMVLMSLCVCASRTDSELDKEGMVADEHNFSQ